MSSVVCVQYAKLKLLGRILISWSDLVVANLFVHSLPGSYDSTFITWP